jgi:hypothetical protein
MNMKKHIVGCLLLLGTVSCNDFLEVMPVGKTVTPAFFSDMDGIRAALPGAYHLLFGCYDGYLYKYPEVAGNMLYFRNLSDNAVNQYNFVSDAEMLDTTPGAIWRNVFEALNNVNNIIQYQPSLLEQYPGYARELNRIKAEALFLRALCHFELCRVYAQPYSYTPDASHLGVPVLRKSPSVEQNVSRGTVAEVYKLITEDLKESIVLFGSMKDDDYYHASSKASKALLSRIYLYMENWDKAIEYSTEVIDVMPLARGSDYIDMFRKPENGEGKETIFRFTGYRKSVSIAKFYGKEGAVYPADTLYTLFDDPNDIRLQLLKDGNQKDCLKYRYTGIEANVVRNDILILRTSEMYLNRAEAYLNKKALEKAAADLKAIIARALDKDVSEISLPENDKEALRRIIEKERSKELCFEGHQFYDITRRKQNLVREASTNSIVRFMPYPNDRFVLPIPQRELDANPNMQPNPTVNKPR